MLCPLFVVRGSLPRGMVSGFTKTPVKIQDISAPTKNSICCYTGQLAPDNRQLKRSRTLEFSKRDFERRRTSFPRPFQDKCRRSRFRQQAVKFQKKGANHASHLSWRTPCYCRSRADPTRHLCSWITDCAKYRNGHGSSWISPLCGRKDPVPKSQEFLNTIQPAMTMPS